jgi:hypothetical protein
MLTFGAILKKSERPFQVFEFLILSLFRMSYL